MKELGEFIKTADSGLLNPVEEGDYNGLVDCMGHLVAVKDRQSTTDDMFEPLKQTIELLKTYDQEMPEEVHIQLQELPEQWTNTKKIAITTKQQVAPLQANEVANIRKKSAGFDVSQHKFREKFRQIPPFKYNCDEPYVSLDKVDYVFLVTVNVLNVQILLSSCSQIKCVLSGLEFIKCLTCQNSKQGKPRSSTLIWVCTVSLCLLVGK